MLLKLICENMHALSWYSDKTIDQKMQIKAMTVAHGNFKRNDILSCARYANSKNYYINDGIRNTCF